MPPHHPEYTGRKNHESGNLRHESGPRQAGSRRAGKIKSAPVVQAVISRTFEISGLDGKMKPPDWRNCSTGGHPQKKHTLHSTGSGPVRRPSGKPPSGGRRSPTRTGLQALEAPGAPAGKNGRGRISVPGEFSHHFRRLRQACGARYGTSGKPGHHLERRSIP